MYHVSCLPVPRVHELLQHQIQKLKIDSNIIRSLIKYIKNPICSKVQK